MHPQQQQQRFLLKAQHRLQLLRKQDTQAARSNKKPAPTTHGAGPHEAAPAVEVIKMDKEQSVHTSPAAAPTAVLNLPGAQSVHFSTPDTTLYVPAGHG